MAVGLVAEESCLPHSGQEAESETGGSHLLKFPGPPKIVSLAGDLGFNI
jgi:hypothetical protein